MNYQMNNLETSKANLCICLLSDTSTDDNGVLILINIFELYCKGSNIIYITPCTERKQASF